MLLKIGLVLYQCFRRVLMSTVFGLCMLHVYRPQNCYLAFLGRSLAFLVKTGWQPCCVAPASPAAHLCLTARIRWDISAASFCSCKFLWRSDECVLLPFSTHNQNFAVMNSCVAALSLFFSDILTWSANSLYSVQWHIK